MHAFEERVEKNHIYDLVKLIATVKTRTVYRGYNVCYKVFLENGKIDLKDTMKAYFLLLSNVFIDYYFE